MGSACSVGMYSLTGLMGVCVCVFLCVMLSQNTNNTMHDMKTVACLERKPVEGGVVGWGV